MTCDDEFPAVEKTGQGKPVDGALRPAHELLPMVYQRLRRLAEQHLTRESPDHTLQATALVHEAYLRLLGEQERRQTQWQGSAQFFSAAAEAMRRILVEHARSRRRLKRGGDRERVPWDSDLAVAPRADDQLAALDQAMTELEQKDPIAAELVKLRYFAGLTLAEASSVLGLAPRTADRVWAFGRAWLHQGVLARTADEDDR